MVQLKTQHRDVHIIITCVVGYAIFLRVCLIISEFSICVLHYSGNPLEERHSADGEWRDLVATKLKKLKKLDGALSISLFQMTYSALKHALALFLNEL